MSATPAILRAAYLLASQELQKIERQQSIMHMDAAILEERATKCREIKDALKDAACPACLGNGWITARQVGVIARQPECSYGGWLEYVYSCWWQCRACRAWVKRW